MPDALQVHQWEQPAALSTAELPQVWAPRDAGHAPSNAPQSPTPAQSQPRMPSSLPATATSARSLRGPSDNQTQGFKKPSSTPVQADVVKSCYRQLAFAAFDEKLFLPSHEKVPMPVEARVPPATRHHFLCVPGSRRVEAGAAVSRFSPPHVRGTHTSWPAHFTALADRVSTQFAPPTDRVPTVPTQTKMAHRAHGLEGLEQLPVPDVGLGRRAPVGREKGMVHVVYYLALEERRDGLVRVGDIECLQRPADGAGLKVAALRRAGGRRSGLRGRRWPHPLRQGEARVPGPPSQARRRCMAARKPALAPEWSPTRSSARPWTPASLVAGHGIAGRRGGRRMAPGGSAACPGVGRRMLLAFLPNCSTGKSRPSSLPRPGTPPAQDTPPPAVGTGPRRSEQGTHGVAAGAVAHQRSMLHAPSPTLIPSVWASVSVSRGGLYLHGVRGEPDMLFSRALSSRSCRGTGLSSDANASKATRAGERVR